MQTLKYFYLKTVVSCGLLGCVMAGLFHHHNDSVQWAAVVLGMIMGIIILPMNKNELVKLRDNLNVKI